METEGLESLPQQELDPALRATAAVLTSFVQDSIQPQETTVFTDA